METKPPPDLRLLVFLASEPENYRFLFDEFRKIKTYRDRIGNSDFSPKFQKRAKYTVGNMISALDNVRFKKNRLTPGRAAYVVPGTKSWTQCQTRRLFELWYEMHKGEEDEPKT